MRKTFLLTLILMAVTSFAQDTQRSTTTGNNPCIVATVALTNQTANILRTALYTPTSGVFRISAYMTMVVPGSTGSWWLTAYWEDDAGVEKTVIYQVNSSSKRPSASCNTAGGTAACGPSVFVIDTKADIPISYDVGAHAGATGTYDVFIVVEQLL